jgi:hypothetical protein
MKKNLFLLLIVLLIGISLSGCLFTNRMLLGISVNGQGTVVKSPDDQGKGYRKGSIVQLEAIPDEGWRFVSWGLDGQGATERITIKMDKSKSIKAIFGDGQLFVPNDFATIQEAINIAEEGDVIVVSQGVYSENLSIKDKTGITITSTDTKNIDVISNTIIDGGNNGSCVTIENSRDISIKGFTFVNGSGKEKSGPGWSTEYTFGGGFYIVGSENVRIADSLVTRNGSGNGTYGSAFFFADSGVTLVENTIFENLYAEYRSSLGVIYAIESTLNLERNTVRNNISNSGILYAHECTLHLKDNIFKDNESKGSFYSRGGALEIQGSDAIIEGNTIINNISMGDGGGLHYVGSDSLYIYNNTISNNLARGYHGGGLYISSSGKVEISSNTIDGNSAPDTGGGVHIESGRIYINDNTITNNKAYTGGGIYIETGTIYINDNIITNNKADIGGGIYKRVTPSMRNPLNEELLTTPASVEAINEFSNNKPDNVYFLGGNM